MELQKKLLFQNLPTTAFVGADMSNETVFLKKYQISSDSTHRDTKKRRQCFRSFFIIFDDIYGDIDVIVYGDICVIYGDIGIIFQKTCFFQSL